jgi:hypothetical protein
MVVDVVSPGRALAAALAALALAAIVPAGALAAQGCPDQPLERTFLPWSDTAWYAQAPDGGFEAGASGWKLTDGAAVQGGNEPYQVAGADDQQSLALPPGADATTPPICIDIAHPTIRLFARNAGSPLSALHVSVRFRALLGLWVSLPIGVVTGDSEWQPTLPIPVLVNLLSLLGGDQEVAFRFTAPDDGGDWAIDDLYVDPYSKG